MLLEFQIKSDNFFPLPADDLFSALTAKSRRALERLKITKRFEKGASFYSAGDAPRRVYVMREGAGQILLESVSKDILFKRLIVPNEIFGLTETIVGEPYEMRAETITPCVCECIARADFVRYLRDEPQICFRLAEMLAANLQKNRRLFFSSIK